jgi:hypothetical protein
MAPVGAAWENERVELGRAINLLTKRRMLTETCREFGIDPRRAEHARRVTPAEAQALIERARGLEQGELIGTANSQ